MANTEKPKIGRMFYAPYQRLRGKATTQYRVPDESLRHYHTQLMITTPTRLSTTQSKIKKALKHLDLYTMGWVCF